MLVPLELPDPVPGPGDVIVRVAATSVNRLDVLMRTGIGDPGIPFPHVLGCDIVGTVATLGPGTDGYSEGERVVVNTCYGCGACGACRRGDEVRCPEWKSFGLQVHGGYGELVRVPARSLVRPPGGYSSEELACLPMVLSVAWRSLHVPAMQGPGDWVAVRAASGGVGLTALRLGQQMGLRMIALTRSPARNARLQEMGAEAVVDASRGEEAVVKEVRALTGGHGVHLVMEATGVTLGSSIDMVRDGGAVVVYGSLGGRQSTIDVVRTYRHSVQVIGLHNGNRDDLSEAFEFLAAHGVRPLLGEVLGVEQAAEAHRRFERRDHLGKIVLRHPGP